MFNLSAGMHVKMFMELLILLCLERVYLPCLVFLCSGNLSYGLRNTPSATVMVCE
jgi:hypothetical protein